MNKTSRSKRNSSSLLATAQPWSKPLTVLFAAVFVLVGGYALYAASHAAGSPEIALARAGLCLDDFRNQTANNSPVDVWTCNGSAAQHWVMSGKYVKVNGKCLDAQAWGTANGTHVNLYACNGGSNQQWYFKGTAPHTELVNVHSGKCLDDTAYGGKGTHVVLWTCNGGTNQLWHPTFYNPPATPSPSATASAEASTEPSTTPTTEPSSTPTTNPSASPSPSPSPTTVSAAGCPTPATDNGTDTMSASIPADGNYVLWVRMLAPSASANTVDAQVDDASCLHVGGSSSLTAGSLTWVNYQNGNTSSLNTVNLTSGNHSIKLIGTVPGVGIDRILLTTDTTCTPTGTGDNCLAAGTTGTPEIRSGVTGLCLNNDQNNSTDGNKVDVATCDGSAGQQWVMQSDGTIQVAGKCLAVDGNKTTATFVQLWTCAGSSGENWTYDQTNHTLINPNANLCLDDPASSSTSGTGADIAPCNGSAGQQWFFANGSTATSSTPTPTTQTPTPTPSGSTAPTAATCPSPHPTAAVSGYTISACEDFNSGLGAFGPYSGGGAGTVVGTGRTPSQCTVSGGMLQLKQASSGATCGGWMNGFDQQYGYWEVRMKAAYTGTGSGSAPHPVLILWPGSGAWTSELDFFETNLGSAAGGFLHCANSGGNASGNCYVIPSNSIDYSQWHVYGFQWTPTSMTGYIDGTKWWTSSNTSSFQPLADSNLTIQLDNLSGSTPVRPGEMDIDWAHMYK